MYVICFYSFHLNYKKYCGAILRIVHLLGKKGNRKALRRPVVSTYSRKFCVMQGVSNGKKIKGAIPVMQSELEKVEEEILVRKPSCRPERHACCT